ncbi:MAG: hypothetical protein V3T05_09775 [Myxococcota bacterium]
MFTVDPKFTHLDVSGDRVLVLVQSINAVSVKVPGHKPGRATAYIVVWDVGDANASASIYLHYGEDNKAVTYVSEPAVFSITALPQVTEEATEFLESMGFMLDDSAFGTLAKDQQAKVVEQTPLFHADLKEFAAARESNDIAEAEIIEMVPEAVVESEPDVGSSPAPAAAKKSLPTNHGAGADREAVGRLLMSF